MAYYLVVECGEHFVNRELAKHLFGVGDSGLLSLLSKGDIKQKEILGAMVFAISPRWANAAAKIPTVVVQNIDAQVAKLKRIMFDASESAKMSCSDVKEYRSFHVASLQDIKDADKYKTGTIVPTISVLGKKYIVFDAVTEDKPCHVSFAK